jgi:hypothetical protein
MMLTLRGIVSEHYIISGTALTGRFGPTLLSGAGIGVVFDSVHRTIGDYFLIPPSLVDIGISIAFLKSETVGYSGLPRRVPVDSRPTKHAVA